MAVYSEYTDQELVALLKQGDHAAFTAIYERYWEKLFAVAAHKILDLSEAEDIVQQLFINIWTRREALEISSSLNSYLAVAVKYRILKSLDRSFRTRHFSDGVVDEVFDIVDDSTQEWLEFQEVKVRLEKLVDSLPEKCRLVYKLSREEGMSQKQIAAELNISENTVESHMGRALKTIKGGLKSFFLTL